jgi:hypothetical protein
VQALGKESRFIQSIPILIQNSFTIGSTYNVTNTKVRFFYLLSGFNSQITNRCSASLRQVLQLTRRSLNLIYPRCCEDLPRIVDLIFVIISVRSIVDQVSQFKEFLAPKPIGAQWSSNNTLFAFWIGINDVVCSFQLIQFAFGADGIFRTPVSYG